MSSGIRRALGIASALVVAVAGRTLAQEPLRLQRLSAPIVLDGVPDEAAWQQIAPLPLTMYTPVFRGTPTQRTEIRVAYDDEYLYAAGWFYDTEPEGIRINSLYRDRWNGDDAFAVYVDAFNDNQNAKWFGTTPGGIRFDQLVSDDGLTTNGSWDTFWNARTTVTDQGWFAEVRIPFSSLGFRVDDQGQAVMGLTVTRLISRSNERVTFPEIDPRFDFRRPSLTQEVVLQDVRSRKPLYVTPYALTGVSRTMVPAEPTGFASQNNTAREVGLDIRYPLSSQLTLDLTANTDFAQVEADDQQVNLDRFPLFYPERRRFFQENSGLFDMVAGGGTRVFHSRRIGLTPQFTPVPVLGGARLVGRLGGWDVGLLDMQTETQGTTPGENFGVLRVRRPVINAHSTAGLMMTSYFGGDRRNHVLAADGSFRVKGDNYLGVRMATTFDHTDGDSLGTINGSLIDARWERRTRRGLMYNLAFTRTDRDYLPELGFLPRRNFTTANILSEYYFFTDEHRFLRRIWPGLLAFSTFRNGDGALESGMYAFWLQWETKAGGGGWIEPKLFHEDVLIPFQIGGQVDVPAGVYNFADLQLYLHMPTGARLRTSIDLRAGTYFDGRRAQVILTPTWNLSRHLELGADYQATLLRVPDRDQSANIQVARLRIRSALNARTSGNAFVQYNSTTDRLDFNVRLRYAFAEGTDLWLVYNEGLDTERTRELAGTYSPRSLARTLILKYTHTFGL